MSNYFDTKFAVPKVEQYGTHQIMTNVVRPYRTRNVCLDTKHKDGQTYTNINDTKINATFSLPERIIDVKSLTVSSVELPMTMYNIPDLTCNSGNPSTNNCFALNIVYNNGNNLDSFVDSYMTTPVIIKVDYNNYDAQALVDNINYQLSLVNLYINLGTRYSIYTYFKAELSNGKINFKVIDKTTYSALRFNIKFDVDSAGNSVPLKSSLGWKMGFRVAKKTSGSNSGYNINDFTAAYAPSLHLPRYLYVALNDFTPTAPNSFFAQTPIPRKNIIAKLCCDSTTDIQTFSRHNGKLITDTREYGKSDLTRLQVELLDEDGNTVDLNGEDMAMTLEIVCY